MDRRTRNVFAVALIVVLLASGGAVLLLGGSTAGPSGPPPGTTAVDGVVVGVSSNGLTSVGGFTLRTADGSLLTFDLSQLRNGAQFAPGHLAEHQLTAARVRVWYRIDGGVREAQWLADAP